MASTPWCREMTSATVSWATLVVIFLILSEDLKAESSFNFVFSSRAFSSSERVWRDMVGAPEGRVSRARAQTSDKLDERIASSLIDGLVALVMAVVTLLM